MQASPGKWPMLLCSALRPPFGNAGSQAELGGVSRHGVGKWRLIQKDPEFAAVLLQRSNVDLKVGAAALA